MYSKIVAKISLSICIVTFAILMMVISVVVVDHNGSYNNFIHAQAISQKNIPFIMAIAGLLLILLSALISWSISLYASFKIAGPLYRFSQNLSHCHRSDKMLSLRSGDYLQDLSIKIINAAKHIENHKYEMLKKIEEYQQIAKLPDEQQNQKKLADILQQLKQLESRALLDE